MPDRSYRWEWPYTYGRGGVLRPMLPVRFAYHRTTKTYLALVDSGADRSAVHSGIAREAGIVLEDFPAITISGVGGRGWARRCPLELELFGRRIATEVYVVEGAIVLLGRQDVFAAFQFGFDERAQTLLIEPY